MKHYIPLLVICSTLGAYLDSTDQGYEQYQDIFINGTIVQKATHHHTGCDTRYELIKQLLEQFNRPFTLLDIGASQGYYSFRAAYDYAESVCVMIEGNNPHYPLVGSQLLDLCKKNTLLHNIILLNKAVTIPDMRRLSECEHFDVILALNILHWFPAHWKELLDTIINLGTCIIIETPPQETVVTAEENRLRAHIENHLLGIGAQVLGEVPRHTSPTTAKMYLIVSDKNYLVRKTWLAPVLSSKSHVITADFNQKSLRKKVDYPPNTYQTSDWIPGINLLTFKMYHGAYPTAAMLKTALSTIQDKNHSDWIINNMILKGDQLELIDFDDPNHAPQAPGGVNRCSPELLQKHCTLMDMTDPPQIERFFWHHLLKKAPVCNCRRCKKLRRW